MDNYIFRGNIGHEPATRHADSPKEPEPYVAAKELVQAVNLAIYLERPLLLEGEAGCGKTRLARAVAYELGLPFYPWYVRSTSKAQEGLYTYDAMLRLHDVQTQHVESQKDSGAVEAVGKSKARDPRNAKDYRRLGPLGKAFATHECPAVVLIDEIDKADVDFPNDLLSVLDHPWEFEIPETGEVIKASAEFKPIVIITSNKEKGNLPAPFLRRCIYYFVDFLQEENWLREVVDIHYNSTKRNPPTPVLIDSSIRRFFELRQEAGLHKKPGTSEFLDWLEALRAFGPSQNIPETLEGALPYPELLLKLRADWQRYAATR
jgi:MoxR-like ATPase